jgi:hypothetical protein
MQGVNGTSMNKNATLLSLADSPHSGLGDRLSAWISIFALAHVRHEDVLFTTARWLGGSNDTNSREANQAADVQALVRCLRLPPHVRRHKGNATVKDVRLRRVFAPKVGHAYRTRPSPAFAQRCTLCCCRWCCRVRRQVTRSGYLRSSQFRATA